VALTSASGGSSGYQGYYVTESSNSTDTNRHSWKAFDTTTGLSTADNAWANDENTVTYNGTDNAYTGSFNLGTGADDGEWIKLQLPIKIKLHFIRIWLRSNDSTRIPEDWKLYGSSDDSNWTELLSVTGQASINENLYEVDTTSMYDYFAVVVTKISGQNNYFRIVELEYHGVPEYDPDAHGTDVIARSIPNVPNTDFLEVYYDGQDYTSMPSTITDKSGNGVTGTPESGVGFDTEYKAFTFPGGTTNETIYNSSFTQSGGDYVHSVSVWFNASALDSTYQNLFWFGALATNQGSFLKVKDKYINWDSVNDSFTYDINLSENTWYHAVMAYSGGGMVNHKVYVNGVSLQNPTATSATALSATLNIPTSTYLILAHHINSGNTSFVGKIANFRLFNRALTGDEIWQLYAYQKDYFQVSPDVVTFKGGRLGVGTEEPRAVLDVKGSIHTNGHPAWPAPTAQFYKASGGTASQMYRENITRTGRIDLDNTVRETPDVIERYTWSDSTNKTTANSTSGGIIKFCLPGTYCVSGGISISKQSTHDKGFSWNFYRATGLGGRFTVGYNTHGPSYGGITPDTQVNHVQGHRKQWMVHVTEAPAYGYPWFQPSANDGTYFRFETWADTPVAHVDIFYLG
jgi:hypothetical protein